MMTDQSAPQPKLASIPTASRCLSDGTLVELVYDSASRTTALVVWKDGRWTLEHELIAAGERLVPFSPENNLIKNNVILLPTVPTPYGSKENLVDEIRAYLHRYLDISPSFEQAVVYYVLFTWLYDAFGEVPYLRFQGDYGTGKTRALLVAGALCYKAFFASGASTVSPLFHIIDAFRGTLVLDEADFRFSDEKAEIVKLLNNGNVDGLPVLRTMINRQREFNPQAFRVFGPKLIAMRKGYEDQALESRFLTEVMGQGELRSDIPINLPPQWKDEAQALRNKLLLFRLQNRHAAAVDGTARVEGLAPRGNQILLPLLSIIDEPTARRAVIEFAVVAQAGVVADRALSTEAELLEVIRELSGEAHKEAIPILEIADRFAARFANEYERPISPRWIGTILRQRLHLTPFKSNGRFVLGIGDGSRLQTLYRKHGMVPECVSAPASDPNSAYNFDPSRRPELAIKSIG